ncbi:MFS general substrate transporter, partial [Neoconidiobolus thromboides FSU 785]
LNFYSLALVIFLSFLDGTILTTALANILNDFGSFEDMTWVAASYMMTSTATQPLYGKLSDIFGRKVTLMVAILLFSIGSLLCGLSTSLIMLIWSRALTGAGGGGLICLSIIIISDIVPLRKRSIYMSISGLMFTLSSLSGPLVGGLISDLINWRWTFFINLPLCLIAILILYFLLNLPKPVGNFYQKLKSIDYLGLILLLSATSLLLLGIGWGGKQYNWNSLQVLLPISISILLFVIFIYIENNISKDPIIPLNIINNNVLSANITMFFIVFPYFFILFYMPIYYQVLKGESATISGLELLPIMVCTVICSILSGIYTNKTGKYKLMNQMGTFLILLGCSLFGIFLRSNISRVEEMFYLLLISGGFGLCIQTSTIICQTATLEKESAVVTSLISFSQSMGSVFGLALCSIIYKFYLNVSLTEANLDINQGVVDSLSSISQLDEESKTLAIEALFFTFKMCYRYMILVSAIAFVSSLFLKHIVMRQVN